MANLTAAQACDRALEAIGIKAAGQDSSAEDANRAGESYAAVYAMLRKDGLAPFDSDSIPDWAQSAVVHLTALELTATFGVTGARMESVRALAEKGRRDLQRQCAGSRQPIPITAEYF